MLGADEVMDMEEDLEDVGGQDPANVAYDYANLAAAMDDGDAVSSQGTLPSLTLKKYAQIISPLSCSLSFAVGASVGVHTCWQAS